MPFASALAVEENTTSALEQCLGVVASQLEGPADLAVVFYTPHHGSKAAEIATAIQDHLRPQCVMGCVGEGVVGTGRELEHQPGISLWAGRWIAPVHLETCHLTMQETPDGPSLLGWPDTLVENPATQATMLLAGDPFSFPAMELFLPQVNADHKDVRVFGGMASGMTGPGQTTMILNGEVKDAGAVGVLLRGPVGVRGVISQGCRPVGRTMVITKGKDNIIFELSGKTPLEQLRATYQELSPRDQDLFQRGPHLGLVINEYQEHFGRGDFHVRNLLGVDKGSGVMAIADHIRIGQTVQFHVRDAESADEDFRLLLSESCVEPTRHPAGALLFTCNGRGTRLFTQPDHDAAVVRELAGAIPLAGLFAAGELGPVGGQNFIHGFTASLVLFDDD